MVSNVYGVEISLAGNVTGVLARDIPVVAAADLSKLGVQMLLGRDILSKLVLTDDGPKGEFSLAIPDIL